MMHAESQTEGSILTQTEAASGAENLASFLFVVMPHMEEALRENEVGPARYCPLRQLTRY